VTFEHPGSLEGAVWRLLWLSFVSGLGTPKFFRHGFGLGLIPLMRMECQIG
jgi:hypothetical protein